MVFSLENLHTGLILKMTNNNLRMFCLTLEPNHLSVIEQMNYINNWGGKFVIPIPRVSII